MNFSPAATRVTVLLEVPVTLGENKRKNIDAEPDAFPTERTDGAAKIVLTCSTL